MTTPTVWRTFVGATETRQATLNTNLAAATAVVFQAAPAPMTTTGTSITKTATIISTGTTSVVEVTLTTTELVNANVGRYLMFFDVTTPTGSTPYPNTPVDDQLVIDPDPAGA